MILAGTQRVPLLYFWTRLHFALLPLAAKGALRHSVSILQNVFLVVALVTLNDGRFGLRQTVAASFCLVASAVGMNLVVGLSGTWKNYFSPTAERKDGESATEQKPEELSGHVLAGLIRWWQLVDNIQSTGDFEELGPTAEPKLKPELLLLHHNSKDELCPCALTSCAGGIAKKAAVFRAVDLTVTLIWSNLNTFLRTWTAAVTFASSYWTAWYGVVGFLLAKCWRLSHSVLREVEEIGGV